MHNKRNIISLFGGYETDCGGESIAVERLFQELQKQQGAAVKLLGFPRLTRSGSFFYFSWIVRSLLFWFTALIKNRYTTWVYTPVFTAGFAASLLKPMFGYRICFHYHGSRLPAKTKLSNPLKNLTHQLKYKLTWFMHQYFLLRSDMVFVPSQDAKKTIVSEFPVLEHKPIYVVPNGVDLVRFHPELPGKKVRLKRQYSISSEYVLMYIGRLNQTKRIDLLLKVLSYLKQSVPNIVLLVAHHPPSFSDEIVYQEELKQQIVNDNLSRYVFWITGEDKVSNLYNMSDIVILVSREENFPLVMLETLACKTLFMGPAIGAIKEILTSIDPILLIDEKSPEKIAKHVETVLTLPKSHKQEIVRRGFQLAGQYSWERASRTIYRYLSEVAL